MFLVHNANTVLSISGGDQFFCETQRDLRAALGLPEPYLKARERFDRQFGNKEFFFENLMVSVFFHMRMPDLKSSEALWKSYVNFCNLYSAYRFLSVMSCREGVTDCRAELFRLLVLSSRALIHNRERQNAFRDGLFENDSATLAHMAILLSG